MGRVLVFTLPTCTHCRAAKATLARRGVPYVEVSLSAHPTRRGDMESLSNRATVPQIFLNDHHVGGASDLQTLIDADPDAFDARARAALAAPDPADPRLAAPAPDDADDERTRGSLAPSRDDRTARVPSHPRPVILTLAGEPIDHVAAVALLREILPLEDRPWNLTVFRRCVPGSVAVDAMLSRFGTRAFASREDAVDALRRLQRAGVLCHVRDEHPFDDVPDLFYRLAPDQSPSTVNGFRADAEATSEGSTAASCDAPARVADSLRRIARIHSRHVDETTGLVEYAAVASDPEWLIFLDSLALLRRTRLADVTPLRRRVATLINLYNLGVATSRATVGAPRSSSERSKYFDDVRWVLGGRVYTLDDVEHGLLRGNRPHPYRLFPQFARRDDPRAADGVPAAEVDCRVHFALNCGAKSCPPVDVYTERGLDAELEAAARAFNESSTAVDVHRGVARVSSLYRWYRRDFGANDVAVATKIMGWLAGERRKALEGLLANDAARFRGLEYEPYDWTDDGTPDSPTYTAKGAKSNVGRITGR